MSNHYQPFHIHDLFGHVGLCLLTPHCEHIISFAQQAIECLCQSFKVLHQIHNGNHQHPPHSTLACALFYECMDVVNYLHPLTGSVCLAFGFDECHHPLPITKWSMADGLSCHNTPTPRHSLSTQESTDFGAHWIALHCDEAD